MIRIFSETVFTSFMFQNLTHTICSGHSIKHHNLLCKPSSLVAGTRYAIGIVVFCLRSAHTVASRYSPVIRICEARAAFGMDLTNPAGVHPVSCQDISGRVVYAYSIPVTYNYSYSLSS